MTSFTMPMRCTSAVVMFCTGALLPGVTCSHSTTLRGHHPLESSLPTNHYKAFSCHTTQDAFSRALLRGLSRSTASRCSLPAGSTPANVFAPKRSPRGRTGLCGQATSGVPACCSHAADERGQISVAAELNALDRPKSVAMLPIFNRLRNKPIQLANLFLLFFTGWKEASDGQH